VVRDRYIQLNTRSFSALRVTIPYIISIFGLTNMNHAFPVYDVFNNLTLREDVLLDSDAFVFDKEAGQYRSNFLYVSETNDLTTEFKRKAMYEYGRCLRYSLAIGCEGRDWHDVLAQMVGFDRSANVEPSADTPFREILHPAIQSATLGPKVARKLLGDFHAWDERAKILADAEFYLAYWWLRCCFTHASNDGAVQMNWEAA
jgi:hypothetical protein